MQRNPPQNYQLFCSRYFGVDEMLILARPLRSRVRTKTSQSSGCVKNELAVNAPEIGNS